MTASSSCLPFLPLPVPGTVPALVILVVRVMLPGLLLAAGPVRDAARAGILPRTGRALFSGVLANLLPAVCLLSVGAWTPLADWLVWFAVVAWAGFRCVRNGGLGCLCGFRSGGGPVLAVLAAAALVVALPARSEWRMGGWDPGFYQNNAVRIALDGSLRGPRSGFYAGLEARDPEAFGRLVRVQYGSSYRAIADSLPVADGGRIPLFFFHLTPAAGAALYRIGGDAFLDRINGFFAFGLLFPFAAFLGSLGMSGLRRALPMAFMALSPLWWYHQNFPTSEMLYLFLLLGGAADWLDSRDVPGGRPRLPWQAWLACFLLVVNHLNAAVLVSGFVAVASFLETAAAEAPLPRRDRLVRAGGAVAALAAGFLWDVACAGVTVRKLQAENGRMLIVVLLFAAAAAACLALAATPFPGRFRRRAVRAARGAGLFAAVLVPLVALTSLSGAARDFYYVLYDRLFRPGEMLWWLMRLFPFFNIPSLVLAGAGFAWLALQRDPRRRRSALAVLAFGAVFFVVLLNPGIRKLYPWALRRFFVFALPPLAIAEAEPVAWAVGALRRRGAPAMRAVAAVVLAAALGVAASSVRGDLDAARAGDYPGLLSVLRTLRGAMGPGDVLVADNAAWIAPFALAEGIDCVNGERLQAGSPDDAWREADPGVRAAIHCDLAAALPPGGRVLWLTTSSRGLDIYPERPAAAPDPLVSADFPCTSVVHGQRNKFYSTQTRTVPVRLFAGVPGPGIQD